MFETAGDVDGDGYMDVLSFIGSMVGVPELERVYFGAPTACGDTGCRASSALSIPGHDRTVGGLRALIAPAGDIDGDGGDDFIAATPANGTVSILPHRRRAPASAPVRVPDLDRHGRSFGTSLAGLFGTAAANL